MSEQEHSGLDELDKGILAFLQQDGRTPYTKMAAVLGVAEGTIRKRVRRLEDAGYVRIVGVTDPFRTGIDTVALLWFKVERGYINHVVEAISSLKETWYVSYATGAFDLVVIVMLQSRQELLRFLNERVGRIKGIQATDTSIILEIRKQTYDWAPWAVLKKECDRVISYPSFPAAEVQLDEIDRVILSYLQKDGRFPLAKIARNLDVTERTVRRRVAAMVSAGILRIVGVMNPFKVGMNTVAIVGITVDRQYIEQVVEQLVNFREIRYVALSTGKYDIIIEVVLPGNAELYDFLVNRLSRIEGISQTDTSLVLRICKMEYSWGVG